VGDFLILKAIRESQGIAIAVSDEKMLQHSGTLARFTGIFPAPEGGACLAAQIQLLEEGWIKENESVVLFNTGILSVGSFLSKIGTGLKYVNCWKP